MMLPERFCTTAILSLALTLLSGCGDSEEAPPTPTPTLTATASATLAPTKTATPPPTATPLPEARIEILTDTSTIYYEVWGTSTATIFDSIDFNAPQDEEGTALGLTSWVVRSPNWERVPNAFNCQLLEFTMTVDIVVTLPRLVEFDTVTAEIQERWQTLLEEITAHEQRHVDILLEGVEHLTQELESVSNRTSCTAVDAAIEGLVDQGFARIDEAQHAFHEEDDAIYESRRAPLQNQINSNQAELEGLEGQIASLEIWVSNTDAEIASIEEQLAKIDSEVRQIEASYPSLILPSPTYERYNALVQNYNNQLGVYNSLIGQYNDTLSELNSLTRQFNSLLLATDEIIEELIWLQ